MKKEKDPKIFLRHILESKDIPKLKKQIAGLLKKI